MRVLLCILIINLSMTRGEADYKIKNILKENGIDSDLDYINHGNGEIKARRAKTLIKRQVSQISQISFPINLSELQLVKPDREPVLENNFIQKFNVIDQFLAFDSGTFTKGLTFENTLIRLFTNNIFDAITNNELYIKKLLQNEALNQRSLPTLFSALNSAKLKLASAVAQPVNGDVSKFTEALNSAALVTNVLIYGNSSFYILKPVAETIANYLLTEGSANIQSMSANQIKQYSDQVDELLKKETASNVIAANMVRSLTALNSEVNRLNRSNGGCASSSATFTNLVENEQLLCPGNFVLKPTSSNSIFGSKYINRTINDYVTVTVDLLSLTISGNTSNGFRIKAKVGSCLTNSQVLDTAQVIPSPSSPDVINPMLDQSPTTYFTGPVELRTSRDMKLTSPLTSLLRSSDDTVLSQNEQYAQQYQKMLENNIAAMKSWADELKKLSTAIDESVSTTAPGATLDTLSLLMTAVSSAQEFGRRLKLNNITDKMDVSIIARNLTNDIRSSVGALGLATPTQKTTMKNSIQYFMDPQRIFVAELETILEKVKNFNSELNRFKRSKATKTKCTSSTLIVKDDFQNKDPEGVSSPTLCPGNFSMPQANPKAMSGLRTVVNTNGPKSMITFYGFSIALNTTATNGFRIIIRRASCVCGQYIRPQKFVQSCGFAGAGVANAIETTGQCTYLYKSPPGSFLRLQYKSFNSKSTSSGCNGPSMRTSLDNQMISGKSYCGTDAPVYFAVKRVLMSFDNKDGDPIEVKGVSVNAKGADTYDETFQSKCLCGVFNLASTAVVPHVYTGRAREDKKVLREAKQITKRQNTDRIINGDKATDTCFMAKILKYNPLLQQSLTCQGVIVGKKAVITSSTCVGTYDEIQNLAIDGKTVPVGLFKTDGLVTVIHLSAELDLRRPDNLNAPICSVCLPCAENTIPKIGVEGVAIGLGHSKEAANVSQFTTYVGKIADCQKDQLLDDSQFCVSPVNNNQYGCSGATVANRETDLGAPFITKIQRQGYLDHYSLVGLMRTPACLSGFITPPSDLFQTVFDSVEFIMKEMLVYDNACVPQVAPKKKRSVDGVKTDFLDTIGFGDVLG